MRTRVKLAVIVFSSLVLVACGSKDVDSPAENKDVYRLAWQFIIQQLDSTVGVAADNARITRLELVDYCVDSVSIYALEYSYSLEGKDGYVPGGTGQGSPYLFVIEEEGVTKLLGVRYTREILCSGGYELVAAKLLAAKVTMDLSKPSTGSNDFTSAEIDAAIQAVQKKFSENFDVINIWFDESFYLTTLETYKDNTLYGIDEAAARGDLIILLCDVYSYESEIDVVGGTLFPKWTVVLERNSPDELWSVVTYGY